MVTANPTEPHSTVPEESNPPSLAGEKGCRKTGLLAQGHEGTLWQRQETSCPEGQLQSMNHKIPFPLLPAKRDAPAALSTSVSSDHSAVLSLRSRSLKGYVTTSSVPLRLCCKELDNDQLSLPAAHPQHGHQPQPVTAVQ